jgi:hypothetical protein
MSLITLRFTAGPNDGLWILVIAGLLIQAAWLGLIFVLLVASDVPLLLAGITAFFAGNAVRLMRFQVERVTR